jgi:hypothetical protein
MKKILEKIKKYKKKKAVKDFKEEHEDWLGAEARVFFSKEDEKTLKQMRRKK